MKQTDAARGPPNSSLSRWIIGHIGAPQSALEKPWVRWLCAANGLLALTSYLGQLREKARFPGPDGTRKVAAFGVMNAKYVGVFRLCLFAHIASGMTAQLGSSLAIFLEERSPTLSRRLAKIAAIAEAFVHAPTAFMMSPFVYGDKGVVPYLYGIVSFLLQVSGLSALEESADTTLTTRPELRRMCTTISIFLYVRLYAIMRGVAGFLRKQKYSMGVMTAGTAMMPVGWAPGVFPASFWLLMALNRKTAGQTMKLVRAVGIDRTAAIQTARGLA